VITRVLLFLAFALFVTPDLFALGQARITGTVLDVRGQPIEGATITVRGLKRKFVSTAVTDESGSFELMIIDASQQCELTIGSEGLASLRTTTKFALIPAENVWNVFLSKTAAVRRLPTIDDVRNDAVNTYNEAVALLDVGDLDGAEAKFREALALNGELLEAHKGLFKVLLLSERWEEALRIGEAIAGDGEIEELVRTARDAKGSDPRRRAHETLARARQTINDGETEGVERLLRQAVELDPKLAEAHFELGMWLAGEGETQAALESLHRYVELAPTGAHALEARAMIEQLSAE
jgi:tetratricopeptide (TPR) repeat protein